MKDFLKQLCSKEKIKLIYTNNKITLLSFSFNKNIPVIRSHSIFMNCPENIANAIVNYYSHKNNLESNLRLIEGYISEFSGFKAYRILPPNEHFKNFHESDNSDKKEAGLSPEVEANISRLVQKSFRGNTPFETKDNSIQVSEDDILEIDIVIKPFTT